MTLQQIMGVLPESARRRVQIFAEYLWHKSAVEQRGTPSFRWAGILGDEGRQHSSVELQHEMLASRSGDQ